VLGGVQICETISGLRHRKEDKKGDRTMASNPTHEQAQLHLQLYEQRREPRLRQARDWFWANCYADTLDEAMRIAPPGTEAGTSFMMVISYWDQACALLNYGLLHEDLFFETNGEFFGVCWLVHEVPSLTSRLIGAYAPRVWPSYSARVSKILEYPHRWL
jgi:hypothetical protein